MFCGSTLQRVIGRCTYVPVTSTRHPRVLKSTSQCMGQRACHHLCPLVMAVPILTTSGEEKSQSSRWCICQILDPQKTILYKWVLITAYLSVVFQIRNNTAFSFCLSENLLGASIIWSAFIKVWVLRNFSYSIVTGCPKSLNLPQRQMHLESHHENQTDKCFHLRKLKMVVNSHHLQFHL